ncbi:MAG: sulfotransferase [Granulosicoccaceae bacterium]
MTDDNFKVDFFCVGAAKAGTTTLHDLLSLQNNVSLPQRKETNYFSFGILGNPAFTGPLDNSSVNEPTVTSLAEYINDFHHEEASVVGEVCPSYSLNGAAANIYKHNPKAKIIILLREPVSRSFSNYQHLVRDGREHSSFEDALAAEDDRLAEGWEWFWGLKRNSFYFDFVKEYIEIFGLDNVKILLFEDFVKNQEQHLKEVMDFIGLDSSDVVYEEFSSNKSGLVSGKWKYLHRILLSEGILNSALRVIIPPKLRKKLGLLFKSFSTVKGDVSKDTKFLLSRELSSDLDQLNTLIGGRVGEWLGERDVP